MAHKQLECKKCGVSGPESWFPEMVDTARTNENGLLAAIFGGAGKIVYGRPLCPSCALRYIWGRGTTRQHKEWLRIYKEAEGCYFCGETFSYALEFHHIDPQEKAFNVSQKIGNGVSIASLLAELEKCMILCSNCHRKQRYGYYDQEMEEIEVQYERQKTPAYRGISDTEAV